MTNDLDLLEVRKLRGVFVNTTAAMCSIYESGRQVFDCLKNSSKYTLEYIGLDELDRFLAGEIGPAFSKNATRDHAKKPSESFDFWILNYHPDTMEPYFLPSAVSALAGLKFAIVLEVEPDNPIRRAPQTVFDYYMVLDPSAQPTEKIVPFPRPLSGKSRQPGPTRNAVPVIGSFGLGTPGKGFEHVVEAVNREFDEAIVRINVPESTYADPHMFKVHGQSYAVYLKQLCEKIAKPGIRVEFTQNFMDDDALIDWCMANDLNCFMYTRRQSGLSATTDQAIISGRPLLLSSNDTFRHIHQYLPFYPLSSMRQAIATSGVGVQKMQVAWSSDSFRELFTQTLERANKPARWEQSVVTNKAARILVVCLQHITSLKYAQRALNVFNRLVQFEIVTISAPEYDRITLELYWNNYIAIVVVGAVAKSEGLRPYLADFDGQIIWLSTSLDSARSSGDLFKIIPRQPLIPYHTTIATLPPGPPRIMLIGFAHEQSNLERIVAKIQRDRGDAQIVIAAFPGEPNRDPTMFDERLDRMATQLAVTPALTISYVKLPSTAHDLIQSFGKNSLTVFYNQNGLDDNILNLCELALVAERPVAFTAAAPFLEFSDLGVIIEDIDLNTLMALGVGANVGLYNRFGEGAFAKKLIDTLKSDDSSPGRGANFNADWRQQIGVPPCPNTIIEGAAAEWYARLATTTQTKLPAAQAYEPPHLAAQQGFLRAAAERATAWDRAGTIIVYGDSRRPVIGVLRELGYNVALAESPLAVDFDVVLVANAFSDIEHARATLSQASVQLRTGGVAAFTFFCRESYAVDDYRENIDFPSLSSAEIEVLLSEFALTIEGPVDWVNPKPSLLPRPFAPPPLVSVVCKKSR